ncbi:MAG TPA: hypothetical protein VNJ47_03555, partial [Nevskiales bacterium]|nr:hypothetical protein [Nevskiales bacterium]
MLLATKLHIPVRQHALVARPRLLDKLNSGLRSRLILLSTPPGFGKTTLLIQWMDSLRAQPGDAVAVAWLALDEGDNDPARFFAYLSAAVESLCPGSISAGQPPSLATPGHELIMIELINVMAASAGQRLLVLDDYHVLHTPALHQAVAFLIEHMPPTLHLVISTRADAPLPLARWRARRELTELREADLRFREEETHEFLTAIMGIEITAQDAATLQQRTEGWIAGLQLAALSMQSADDVAHQVQRFAGAHTYIGDYLAEEVLQRQPPEIQHFLFDTSILPRLCAALCNAVTGRTDSAAVLAALHRAHLFLIPLDDGQVWYRYHHLFAEMLRSRLMHGDPERVRELHCRAARWHLDNNGIGDNGIGAAIHHALAADPALAADLLERHCGLFQQRGEYITLDGWLRQLPDAIYPSRPQLCLLRAKTHLFLHEVAEAEAWLARTRQSLREAPDLDPDASTLLAALIVQCDLALNRSELDAAISLAQQALALLRPEQLRARGEVLMLLGVAYFWRSDFALAHEAWVEAGNAATASDHILMAVYARGNAARALYQQGRLRAAAAALDAIQQDAARRGDTHLPLYAGCHIAQAEIHCEWNQLEAAHQRLMTGLALARQARNPRTLLQGHAHLLRALLAQGRLDEAAEAAAQAKAMIRQ